MQINKERKTKMRKKQYRSFEKARKFVWTLKLKNTDEWIKYSVSGNKPEDIPGIPRKIYKNKGWMSMGDWLGTGIIATKVKSKSFLSPKEAKPVLKKLFKEYEIKNLKDWSRFVKTHGKLLEELHLPTDVLVVYSEKNAMKWKK